MRSEPLVRAIISAMMLLEECEADEVNPDTAVRGLENMGYELLKLTGADRAEFLELLERMAAAEEDAHTAEFMRQIPFAIGMVEAE